MKDNKLDVMFDGTPEDQARPHATALDAALHDSVVTRGDLQAELQPIKSDVAAIRTEMLLLEQRMTIKLGGMLIVAVGIVLAAIRYLPAGH